MEQAKLAIVIPAYKAQYLDECLASIAAQSNKNFSLYIGDDNSPYGLEKIVEKYKDDIDLHYKKFDSNLGTTSLVKQWNRCVQLTGTEEWIWLFADDDMMQPCAVDHFLKIQLDSRNVYRYNMNTINNANLVLKEARYQLSESPASFLKNRLMFNYDNAITHYIFSRESFIKSNGFVDFPMAWGSDDASIIQFCNSGNIILIEGCIVSWRNDGNNISSNLHNKMLQQKLQARLDFVRWIFREQPSLIKQINDHKILVSNWIYHAMQAEAPGAGIFRQLKIVSKLVPSVGSILYKNTLKRWIAELKGKIKKMV